MIYTNTTAFGDTKKGKNRRNIDVSLFAARRGLVSNLLWEDLEKIAKIAELSPKSK